MSYLTVETRELEDLRRKYSVATNLLAEQSATITAQAATLRIQADEIAYLRKLLLRMSDRIPK